MPLSAVGRSASDIEGLQEGDLDHADSVDGLAGLRGRLKSAIANFTGALPGPPSKLALAGRPVGHAVVVGHGVAGRMGID